MDISKFSLLLEEHYDSCLALPPKFSPNRYQALAVLHWFESLNDPSSENVNPPHVDSNDSAVDSNDGNQLEWGVEQIKDAIGMDLYESIRTNGSTYKQCLASKNKARSSAHSKASLQRQYTIINTLDKTSSLRDPNGKLSESCSAAAAEDVVKLLASDPGLVVMIRFLIDYCHKQQVCNNCITFGIKLVTLSERPSNLRIMTSSVSDRTAGSGGICPSGLLNLLDTLASFKNMPFSLKLDPELGNKPTHTSVTQAPDPPCDTLYFTTRMNCSNGTLKHVCKILSNGLVANGYAYDVNKSNSTVNARTIGTADSVSDTNITDGSTVPFFVQGTCGQPQVNTPEEAAAAVADKAYIGGEEGSPIRTNIDGSKDGLTTRVIHNLSVVCPIL